MVQRRSIALATASLIAVSLALVGCSGDTGSSAVSTRTATAGTVANGTGDISAFCGTKPAKVAYLKSSGGNTWALQSAAEFQDEASKCSNITSATFDQAVGDQQKAISNLSSVVAQGTNVIVISADYGVPELPGIQAATATGAKVVTILGDAGGTPGTDFVDGVGFDQAAIGKAWADYLHEQLPNGGKVAYLGGTPGNETSNGFFAAFQQAATAYPNLQIVGNAIQDTNWDPVERRKVMAGLLTSNGRIDAIVSDFNAPDSGTIQAYDAAGMKRPIIASITPSNQLACDWATQPYPWLTFGQTSSLPRLALRIGMASYEGLTDSESASVLPKPLEYSATGDKPTCNADFPPDADLTANLTPDQLNKLFSK